VTMPSLLRRPWSVTAALIALLALSACSNPPSRVDRAPGNADTLRTLDTGTVLGYANPFGGHTWLGIPFAAPPVGELRWRAPRPPSVWSGTRNALLPGEPCLQYGSPLGGIGAAGSRQGSEDCLYLNVYAPRLTPSQSVGRKLPVMVWIHGGGNTVGAASVWEGGVLAAREGVLVVMINYRLGPMGWFVPPEGSTVDPLERSGNFGNLDSHEALRWVQRNAAAFGGDPDNVTVFGESAGATNALVLTVAPSAKGLFHKLIVQSNAYGLAPPPSPEESGGSTAALRRLLVATGKAADGAAAEALARRLTPVEAAALLRAADPWVAYEAIRGDTRGGYDLFVSVFADGVVHRAGALRDSLADPATHTDVPMIVGSNRDENKIFMAFDPRLVRTVAGTPVALRDPEAYDRLARYRAALWKADGVDDLATLLARHGAPVFAYRWDWDEQGRAYGVVDLSRILGASHGLEIPFVLGHFDVGPQSENLFHARNERERLALSARMMRFWAEFARTGDPGKSFDDPPVAWLPWADEPTRARRLMVFDTPAGGGTRMTDERVSRDSLVGQMEAEPITLAARCELFRETFTARRDAWADTAYRRFAGSQCPGERLNRSASAASASAD
jgi:para-nitrobenzyl esterase